MKKVLITGANSYIGMNFEKYAADHYSTEFDIDTLDMLDESWKKKDFSLYDVVFHVAGIAHADVGNVSDETKAKYYAVNTNLAIETCKKSKREGVGQFVFMSSSIIYGDSAPCGKRKIITSKTKPNPSNFYGDSKWRADKGVRELQDDRFAVVVLRPPMIYGKGSKGNYPMLAKIARKSPVFPNVINERSVLYIENLCEFLCQVMMREKSGVFWPQNSESIRTSDMVAAIAGVSKHRIVITRMFNWCVYVASHIPGKLSRVVNKAFGSMCYEQEISHYDFDYQLYDLSQSIERTESDG